MEQVPNPNMVPFGKGGVPGHVFRMIVSLCTGCMAYPNTFVEGMDLTAMQKRTQGALYDKKKGADSKSRF
jgi:hypothetical protein